MNKKDLITVTSKAANHNDIISRAPTDMRVVLQSAVNCAAVVTTIQSMLHFNTHFTDFHSPMIMTLWQWRHSSVACLWFEPCPMSPSQLLASHTVPGMDQLLLQSDQVSPVWSCSNSCTSFRSTAPVGPASLWTRSNISTIGSPSHIHPLQSPTLLLLSGLSVLVAG